MAQKVGDKEFAERCRGWFEAGRGGDEALIPAGFLKVQRGFEMEADLLAVQVTAEAGYDPGALVRYMGRVQPEDTGRSRALFALPPRDTRCARRIVVE